MFVYIVSWCWESWNKEGVPVPKVNLVVNLCVLSIGIIINCVFLAGARTVIKITPVKYVVNGMIISGFTILAGVSIGRVTYLDLLYPI